MKRTSQMVIVVLLGAAVGGLFFLNRGPLSKTTPVGVSADAVAPFYSAGPFKVLATLDPETPRVGKNRVTVRVQDSAGSPVSGASLNAVAVMPSMGSMPAMYAPAEMAEGEPGVYTGTFAPSMSGEWPLTIELSAPGIGEGRITFDLATGRKGLSCATCAEGRGSESLGTVRVDPERRQLIGVTTRTVRNKRLRITIRAAGAVTYDQTRLADVALKFDGWIGEIYADSVGKPVRKGEALFTVYSPALLAAQEEYLEVVRRADVGGTRGSRLLESARRRLRLWDLTQAQIAALELRGEAVEYMPILASTDGVVIDRKVVAGSAFKAGQRLLRLADLSRVWVEAQVYDYELPLIEVGMKARVILPELQDREFEGQVDFIYPFMEGDTRTARVRVKLDNADGFLRPDMYAHIHLRADLGKLLLVPESAVLYSGERRVVFLDLGDGRLEPREVRTGLRNRGWIEVLDGLEAGDTVVTSGNFLIAAESRLKSGVAQW